MLDGVRTDEWTGTATSPLTGGTGECWAEEAWATFGADGTVVRAIANTGITVTAPAHVQMLTGRVEPFGNFSVPDQGPGWYLPEYPTVFEEARTQLGLDGSELHLVANTTLLEPVHRSFNPTGGQGAAHFMISDGLLPAREDRPVLEGIQAVIDAELPRLLVVNFHDADRAGHFGESADYVDGVAEQDVLLGELHAWILEEHPGYAENLLIVVTSDHGRHRDYLDENWRNHGDDCTGCRQVPLMVTGAGVLAGAVVDGTFAGIDLGPTVAAWMGVEMPWAHGVPLSPVVPGVDGSAAREGDIDLAVAGDHVAVRQFLGDFDQRSEVRVDGSTVSTPGAFAAEAPVLLATDERLFACFRELSLDLDTDAWPWRARCLAEDDSGWADVGFPEEVGGPLFRPALLPWQDGLVALWGHNPNGIAELGARGDVGLWAATWRPQTGWGAPVVLPAYFPTHVSAVELDGAVLAAFTTNAGDETASWTRKTRLARWDGTELTEVGDVDLASVLGAPARVERPALTTDGAVLRLAVLGFGDDQSAVWVLDSVDGGATWSVPEALASGGDLFPNVSPAWDGDAVVWAASLDGAARICRAAPGDSDATCVDAGSARVDGLVVGSEGVRVTRDAGVGRWETATLSW